MENSLISWCDNTQNFWIGCTRVSPGCLNCYAETLDRNRFSKLLDGGTKDAPVTHWGKGAPRHRTSVKIWNDPLRWDKIAKAGFFAEVTRAGKFIARGDLRRLVKAKDAAGVPLIQEGDTVIKVRPRVFCSSLADILDPEVDPKMLAEALDVIRRCDGLDWLLLTKRPENWRSLMSEAWQHAVSRQGSTELANWIRDWMDIAFKVPPPSNIWMGTTVEDQTRADERIPALLAIPARVRFLSCEPLLGPVEIRTIADDQGRHAVSLRNPSANKIHWVICGGESGSEARPMHPAWARSLRDQCAAAGVPYHFKQWGAWREPDTCEEEEQAPWVAPSGRVFKDVMEIPDDLLGSAQMFRVGKLAAGRLLDGVEHNAFPEVSR